MATVTVDFLSNKPGQSLRMLRWGENVRAPSTPQLATVKRQEYIEISNPHIPRVMMGPLGPTHAPHFSRLAAERCMVTTCKNFSMGVLDSQSARGHEAPPLMLKAGDD